MLYPGDVEYNPGYSQIHTAGDATLVIHVRVDAMCVALHT